MTLWKQYGGCMWKKELTFTPLYYFAKGTKDQYFKSKKYTPKKTL